MVGQPLQTILKSQKIKMLLQFLKQYLLLTLQAETFFLSIAAGYAESLDINDIYIGVNSVDYSGYPDCRKEFIVSFEKLINKCTKKGLEGRF